MHVARASIALAILTLALPASASAGEVPDTLVPNVGEGRVSVTSMLERRYLNVVRQQSDFTCGAAAMATILRYAYGIPIDEPKAAEGLLAVADPAIARERGFSFADMKAYLNRVGFNGDGFAFKTPAAGPGPRFRAPTPVNAVRTLRGVHVPTIALIDYEGYQHFVVVRRTTADAVFVADPALGDRRMPIQDFADDWNGVLFRLQGPGYRVDNPLVAVELPASSGELYAGTAPLPDALLLKTLSDIGVASTNRL